MVKQIKSIDEVLILNSEDSSNSDAPETNEPNKLNFDSNNLKKLAKWTLGGAGIVLSTINIILAIAIFLILSSSMSNLEKSMLASLDSVNTELENTEESLGSSSESIDSITNTFNQLNSMNSLAQVIGVNISISTDTAKLVKLKNDVDKMKTGMTNIRNNVSKLKSNIRSLFSSIRIVVLIFCVIIILASATLGGFSISLFL
ncbi:hypothetical protein J7J90_02235 [Candidatus Micrarchaeota archaeon]|nr:hypothetical protein [Candidatus Micrarchaeota archaeon]